MKKREIVDNKETITNSDCNIVFVFVKTVNEKDYQISLSFRSFH